MNPLAYRRKSHSLWVSNTSESSCWPPNAWVWLKDWRSSYKNKPLWPVVKPLWRSILRVGERYWSKYLFIDPGIVTIASDRHFWLVQSIGIVRKQEDKRVVVVVPEWVRFLQRDSWAPRKQAWLKSWPTTKSADRIDRTRKGSQYAVQWVTAGELRTWNTQPTVDVRIAKNVARFEANHAD